MKNVNDMNRDELRAEAKELAIPGRGKMTAAELRQNVEYFRQETIREQAKLYTKKTAVVLPVKMHGDTPEFLPLRRDRFRDRLARGELVVATPNGVGGRTNR